MKANNTGRTYHERVLDARESLWKVAMEREEERKANPIDWKASAEAGKAVYKKSK
jgi:hypothetical protein